VVCRRAGLVRHNFGLRAACLELPAHDSTGLRLAHGLSLESCMHQHGVVFGGALQVLTGSAPLTQECACGGVEAHTVLTGLDVAVQDAVVVALAQRAQHRAHVAGNLQSAVREGCPASLCNCLMSHPAPSSHLLPPSPYLRSRIAPHRSCRWAGVQQIPSQAAALSSGRLAWLASPTHRPQRLPTMQASHAAPPTARSGCNQASTRTVRSL